MTSKVTIKLGINDYINMISLGFIMQCLGEIPLDVQKIEVWVDGEKVIEDLPEDEDE